MNREKTIEAIKVMQAWLDGKVIQARGTLEGESEWADMQSIVGPCVSEHGVPIWNWGTSEYRVKPEPRVVYFGEFSNGALTANPLDAVEVANLRRDPIARSVRFVKFVEVIE